VRIAIATISFLLAFTAANVARAQDARVETFQRVCIEARENFEASEVAALRRGWVTVSEDARPELERIFEFARNADSVETPIRRLQAYSNNQFTDTAIVLSEMIIQGRLINGCYVYDFAATEPLAPEIFVQIVGSPPTEAHFQPGLIVMQKWVAPSAFIGVATLRAGFVPAGSEAGEQVGIVGLALALTSVSQGRAQ
jgi:hypothetical protein